MPDDISLLDQLEEWLEAQVPANLHELPYRMLETMERVSNELFETLNIHGPPSISIPFPPFMGKESLPPPPPPPPVPLHAALISKGDKWAKDHPYLMASGALLAVSVGLGVGARALGYGGDRLRRRRFGTTGVVEDGMLKEAVVLLCPSPMPPLLIPLAATLLRAGYIVLIAVPQVKDAEFVERRLSGLEERSGLRVLIYNPDDSTTFPPFHRSLLATLTLRFPAINRPSIQTSGGPPSVPRIHAFISLYPLNPLPSSQPSALPALPTLLTPTDKGRSPMLITLYPSISVLPTPSTFANQLLTSTHELLSKNLSSSHTGNRIVSVYVGEFDLPTLPAIMSVPNLSRRDQARHDLRAASSPRAKVSILRSYTTGIFSSIWTTATAQLGLFGNARSYNIFETRFLGILKSHHGSRWSLGQYSFLPLFINSFHLPPYAIPYLLAAKDIYQVGLSKFTRQPQTLTGLADSRSSAASDKEKELHKGKGAKVTEVFEVGSPVDSEHEHEHEEEGDLASSIHTVSTSSGEGGSGNGLGESWVGLEAAN